MSWRDLLSRAVLNGEDFAPVEAAIEAGEAQLWTAENSAAVTQEVKYLELPLAAGNLSELLDMLSKAEAQAKANGCQRVICTGRKGWPRVLPGYREITVYVKEL